MDKVRVGVVGVGRGSSMMQYCKTAKNAELVAICDKWEEGLRHKKAELGEQGKDIALYTDYDEFLKHDMDVVMLANYATEHAPFAIKAMKAGHNVISEVLPCQTMKEAVELVETVEQTGKIYCYAENYCYMGAPREMRRLYREGKIGKFEYAEGEYVHNLETCWPNITYGQKDHWRVQLFYANFYCTHSIGPMIHIAGERPVKVVGFELPPNARTNRMGRPTGSAGLELITLENGAVLKSIHGDLARNSIWYTVYGEKGRMESSRESAKLEGVNRVYVESTPTDDDYEHLEELEYVPEDDAEAKEFGHGGSDYYCLRNCMRKILGEEDAETIDVYEAMDMFLPGLFAYRSVLAGGIPMEVPDLRDPAQRDRWRNDTTCPDPKVAGDMWVPAYSGGKLDFPDSVYDGVREKWEKIVEDWKEKTE